MEIIIDGEEYTINKFLLKDWLYLEEAKIQIKSAIDKKDIDVLVASIFKYLSIAFLDCGIVWENIAWLDVYNAFILVQEATQLNVKLPMLVVDGDDTKKQPWDYAGRMWYRWAHIFSAKYGWKLDDIAKLVPDDAISLLQEIFVDEQLDKEWQWSLSEIAYPYNENTKKSKFSPLDRPAWMVVKAPKEIKKIRIRKDMLPIGNVIRLDENTKFA
jgi:hypothetical protein